MKITRLKKGYRLHMSDAEFNLHQDVLHEGFATMETIADFGVCATAENQLFHKINGTEAISDWFVISDDRRST